MSDHQDPWWAMSCPQPECGVVYTTEHASPGDPWLWLSNILITHLMERHDLSLDLSWKRVSEAEVKRPEHSTQEFSMRDHKILTMLDDGESIEDIKAQFRCDLDDIKDACVRLNRRDLSPSSARMRTRGDRAPARILHPGSRLSASRRTGEG